MAPSRSTHRSIAAALLVATTALVVTGCSGARGALEPDPGAPAADFAPPAAAVEAEQPGSPLLADAVDAGWAESVAASTGIPERAIRAYAGAAIVSNRENPGCDASWNTLAGIGRVESRHGEIFGSMIDAAGTASPNIYGVALDGDGVALIPDSDAGAIDGDDTTDRAVGPMQFIPDSWRNWRIDANGDGVADPHNIDDAALAAVHYLCRAGDELADEEGWRTSILAWNRSEEYLADVASWALWYAEAAAE